MRSHSRGPDADGAGALAQLPAQDLILGLGPEDLVARLIPLEDAQVAVGPGVVADLKQRVGHELHGLLRVGAQPLAAGEEGRLDPGGAQGIDQLRVVAGPLVGLLAQVEGQGHQARLGVRRIDPTNGAGEPLGQGRQGRLCRGDGPVRGRLPVRLEATLDRLVFGVPGELLAGPAGIEDGCGTEARDPPSQTPEVREGQTGSVATDRRRPSGGMAAWPAPRPTMQGQGERGKVNAQTLTCWASGLEEPSRQGTDGHASMLGRRALRRGSKGDQVSRG